MNKDNNLTAGFLDLETELEELIKKVSSPVDILEIGAKEFTKDLLRLPTPKSKIQKSSYTHLIDSFSYRKTNVDIEVGWGKYYGPMVEEGTKSGFRNGHKHPGTTAQPHLKKLWQKNKNKYYKLMLDDLEFF